MFGNGKKSIIEPRRGRYEKSLPSKAFLIFVPEDVAILGEYTSCKSSSRSLYLAGVYESNTKAPSFCFIGPVLGASQAVLLVEKIVALGVREIMGIGWGGSLDKNVSIGDIVIPSSAFSEEGTSPHYGMSGEIKAPMEPSFSSCVKEILKQSGLHHFEGAVWTTDAPYRETVEKVLHYQKKKVLAVDMETSALFSVASFRGISLSMMLMISDTLYGLKWVPGMKSKTFGDTRRRVLRSIADMIITQS